MNESQLRDGLRTAVADEPPLGFDPDAVADAARAGVRRRRTVLTATGGTFAVVGVVVAAVALAGIGGAPQLQPLGTSSDQPSPTSEPLGPPTALDPPGLAARADQLIAHVVAVLPQVVPGASGGRKTMAGQYAAGDFNEENWFTSMIAYRDEGGPALLGLQVLGPGITLQIPPCIGVPQQRCTPVTIRDGSQVFFHESVDAADPTLRIRIAYHEHGGSTVMITTYTKRPAGSDGGARPSLPLTDEQLVRLVADPALALP
jgi:hypothetical protein